MGKYRENYVDKERLEAWEMQTRKQDERFCWHGDVPFVSLPHWGGKRPEIKIASFICSFGRNWKQKTLIVLWCVDSFILYVCSECATKVKADVYFSVSAGCWESSGSEPSTRGMSLSLSRNRSLTLQVCTSWHVCAIYLWGTSSMLLSFQADFIISPTLTERRHGLDLSTWILMISAL